MYSTFNTIFKCFSMCLLLVPNSTTSEPIPHIELTPNNHVSVRGTITNAVADSFTKDIILNDPLYVFIDSNGGSVMAGNRMMEQLSQRNITCIATKAYSMAFVLLQACTTRYVLSTSTAMQHQQSLGVRGDLMAVQSYLDMVHAMEEHLTKFQADRIGMHPDKFKTLTNTEWWLFGQDIIDEGVADGLTTLSCSKDLIRQNVSMVVEGYLSDSIHTFNACPLITNALD
jgi:ATP-dependent protease ClpP protease subunit